MVKQEQNSEYELMTTSEKRTIKVQIPDGPLLVCHNSYDYQTNFQRTRLKTLTKLDVTHPLLKITEMDLYPVTSKKIWMVEILRQPESNLKDEQGKKRNPL